MHERDWAITRIVVLICFSIALQCMQGKSFYTIIDDDAANIESVSSIKGLADRKRIKITFAVIGSNILNDDALRDTLLRYQDESFHICNHSLSHNREIWEEGSLLELRSEILTSMHLLDSLGFRNHSYLVYPFGKFNYARRDSIYPIINNHFNLAFNSRGYFNAPNALDKYNVERLPIRKHENISIVKRKIDEAVENDAWIVFMTHSDMPRDYSEKHLGELIDYCREKGLECYTADEAYRLYIQNWDNHEDTEDYTWRDELSHHIWFHIWHIIFGILIVLIISVIYVSHSRLKSSKGETKSQK